MQTPHCRIIRFVPGSRPGPVVRFHCDENVSGRLVKLLRGSGFDVSTCATARLCREGDEAHLRYAAKNGRILITNDVKPDFAALVESTEHAGVLLCNGGGRFPRDVFRRCLKIAALHRESNGSEGPAPQPTGREAGT